MSTQVTLAPSSASLTAFDMVSSLSSNVSHTPVAMVAPRTPIMAFDKVSQLIAQSRNNDDSALPSSSSFRASDKVSELSSLLLKSCDSALSSTASLSLIAKGGGELSLTKLSHSDSLQLTHCAPAAAGGSGGTPPARSWVWIVGEAMTYVTKSPLSLRNAFVGAATLLDLVTRTVGLGRVTLTTKAQNGFDTVAEALMAVRIICSVDYFTSGTIKKEDKDKKAPCDNQAKTASSEKGAQQTSSDKPVDNTKKAESPKKENNFVEHWNQGGNTCKILSEVAYLIARVFSVTIWAAKQGIIEAKAIIAAHTGVLTVFGKTLETISFGAFIAAMSITAVSDAITLITKYATLSPNDIAYNITDIISCASESLILGLLMAGGASAFVLGFLGLVAAGCGIASGVLDPERPMPKS